MRGFCAIRGVDLARLDQGECDRVRQPRGFLRWPLGPLDRHMAALQGQDGGARRAAGSAGLLDRDAGEFG